MLAGASGILFKFQTIYKQQSLIFIEEGRIVLALN